MKRLLCSIIVFSILCTCLSFSVFAETGAGLDVKIQSGGLDSPGDEAVYAIKDTAGNFIKYEDFINSYTFSKDIKTPIRAAEVESEEGTGNAIIRVSLLDSCDMDIQSYKGTVTLKNKANESLTLKIEGTAQHKVEQATNNFKVFKETGAKVYDFSNSQDIRTYYIYFEGDAEIKVDGGVEKGVKCLAYNINPVRRVTDKYNLTGTDKEYAFLNFPGTPTFDSVVEAKFFIPVEGIEPILYRVKNEQSGELEQVPNVTIQKTGTEPVLAFNTNGLANTYLVASTPIDGIEMGAEAVISTVAEPVKQEAVINPEEPLEPEDEVQEIQPASNTTVASPQTGSMELVYTALMILAVIALCVIIKNKR